MTTPATSPQPQKRHRRGRCWLHDDGETLLRFHTASWWNGATGEDYGVDWRGQTWRRKRYWSNQVGQWQKVQLGGSWV
jgi:hypothetical protein